MPCQPLRIFFCEGCASCVMVSHSEKCGEVEPKSVCVTWETEVVIGRQCLSASQEESWRDRGAGMLHVNLRRVCIHRSASPAQRMVARDALCYKCPTSRCRRTLYPFAAPTVSDHIQNAWGGTIFRWRWHTRLYEDSRRAVCAGGPSGRLLQERDNHRPVAKLTWYEWCKLDGKLIRSCRAFTG